MPEPIPRNARVLYALPHAVMVVVAVIDVVAGPSVGFLPLVALGPAFAGLVGGWRRTALIGVLALLLCAGLGLYDGLFADRRGLTALASVAGVTVASLWAAVLRQRRENELARIRSIAEVVQRVLLRPAPHSAGGLDVAVSYTSALAEARVGGDLYEVVDSPAGVRVIVGDVQGKGLEAVGTAALLLGAFREAAHLEPDLGSVCERLERAADRELRGEKFVTAVVAEVGPDHRVTMVNYGHPSPLMVDSGGSVTSLDPPTHAPPLGLGLPGPERPAAHSTSLAPGDQLLLYSDGVTEARGADRRFYPLAERCASLLHPDPKVTLTMLRADLMRYTGSPLHDDAVMLLLRRPGP
ncbi:PP2C family protein-serine/threonine phosphatase [Streptomyces gobitricini]|uniref:PP2C family protein-serine/threonine phosphatase n=1 Tax=Streptomyces gobitricini TaxID=68211 RepID=A0ABN3M1X4_9ACTN